MNGILQERTTALDLDLSRINDNDYSAGTTQEERNLFYQQQLANTIKNQVTQITSLITSTLNIYLNIGQNYTINTPQTFMSLEIIDSESLTNKLIKQIGNAQFRIPSNFTLNMTNNSSISLRVKDFLRLII